MVLSGCADLLTARGCKTKREPRGLKGILCRVSQAATQREPDCSLRLLRDRRLPGPAVRRKGQAVLFRRVTDYDGLLDAMFNLIRTNAADAAAVLIHLLDVLGAVLEAEADPRRRASLLRHADLAHALGRDTLRDAAALAGLDARRAALPSLP